MVFMFLSQFSVSQDNVSVSSLDFPQFEILVTENKSEIINSVQIASSDTDTNLYVITKTNGAEFIGKIISDDGREILILTEKLGKIYILKSDIKSIIKITDKSSIVRGEYHSEGPFTTRHAFTTNALPIKKGENYAMVNLYGPEIHFSLTDHFNIGIMTTWIASPLALAMKYTIPTKNPKLNFSLGTLLGTSGYLNNFSYFGGLHFANVTSGDRKNNITASIGYGYLRQPNVSNPFNIGGVIISIAGIAKVGAKTSFIFDSMLGSLNENESSSSIKALILMPGMRFQTKENRAFQVSLSGVAIFDGSEIYSFPIPTCSWFYKF